MDRHVGAGPRLLIYNGPRRVIIITEIYTTYLREEGVRRVGGVGQQGITVFHGDSQSRVYECPDTVDSWGYKAVYAGSDGSSRHYEYLPI